MGCVAGAPAIIVAPRSFEMSIFAFLRFAGVGGGPMVGASLSGRVRTRRGCSEGLLGIG